MNPTLLDTGNKNATRNPQLCNFHIFVSKDKRLKIDAPVAYCYINEFL